jgi:hypothetical protein
MLTCAATSSAGRRENVKRVVRSDAIAPVDTNCDEEVSSLAKRGSIGFAGVESHARAHL